MRVGKTKFVVWWGMALAVLFAYGCPGMPQHAARDGVQAAFSGTTGRTFKVPNRPPQPRTTVAIIKDDGRAVGAMVAQALEAALGKGGIANLVHRGDTVLIKPNLVYASDSDTTAVTDYRVVQALVNEIRKVNGGAAITIADGSAILDTAGVMDYAGYTAANFPGVRFANFNDIATNPTDTYVLADSRTGARKRIPALITDAAVFIDVPKMKTHYHAGLTGALKNLGIGIGPLLVWNDEENLGAGGSAKYGMHHDIRSEIVDHVACRVPDLTLMDAVLAMEGQGPVGGSMVDLNMVLAGRDPVAVDAIAATIMGIPPHLIAHLVLAANENLGVMDPRAITVTGNISLAAASAIHTFVRAQPGRTQAPVEPGSIPYRATTVIRTAPRGTAIDGDLREWGYANVATVDAAYQVRGDPSGWSGPGDASVVVRTLYDAKNLYLAVEVTDDHPLANPNTGAAIVNGDGIELHLSTFGEQYDTTPRRFGSPHDYRLAIGYAATPPAYMLSHDRALADAVLVMRDTADGYVLEAQIPWSNFGGPTLSPSPLAGGFVEYRQLGVNVALHDADAAPSTVDHTLIWNNAADPDVETDPVKMGMSYVDPPGGLYPALSSAPGSHAPAKPRP